MKHFLKSTLIFTAAFCPSVRGVIVQQTQARAERLPTVDQWGEEQRGLQCRVDAPVEIEQGMPLEVDVHFRSHPQRLHPDTKALNSFLHDTFLELTLTNQESEKTAAVRPHDPTFGMPAFDEGKDTHPLDGTPIESWRVSFPLATVFDTLSPGSYECQIRFTFPEAATHLWRGTAEPWKAAGFWYGTVRSRRFPLEVTRQTAKTKKFLFPRNLQAVHETDEQGRPMTVVRFRKQDAEEVTLPVRNGHFLGWKLTEAETPGGMMQSGTPRPEDANPLATWPGHTIGEKRSLTIEVFETAVRAQHAWMPESNGYRVLWKKTFSVSGTSRE